jgi:hypothetical protein
MEGVGYDWIGKQGRSPEMTLSRDLTAMRKPAVQALAGNRA